MFVERAVEFVVVINLLAVEADNDIAQLNVAVFSLHHAPQPGVGGRTALLHLPNQHATGYRQANLILKRFNIAWHYSQLRPSHFTVLYEFGNYALGDIDRNREANAG